MGIRENLYLDNKWIYIYIVYTHFNGKFIDNHAMYYYYYYMNIKTIDPKVSINA